MAMGEMLGKGLEGKGVLVSGAASGIGRASVKLFAESGARVLAVDVDGDGLERLMDEIEGPGTVVPAVVDLARVGDGEELIGRAIDELGNIYVLALVAAALKRQPIGEVTDADWAFQVDVNLKATFFLNRAAAEAMKAAGHGGRIINFTSGAWLTGPIYRSDVYVITKGGIVTLTRGFARQYGAYGILSNVVSPGQIDTPMQHRDNTAEMVAAGISGCPLGRMGQPEEIAKVVLFLASDHASFVNGATINVSGGSITY
jgi:NAD(P)-dependent dehydrogenase (short-subunit alcohol dehydrogenase family)